MNNREWLNTLSDEEYADVFEPRGNTTEPYCEINYTNCPKKPRSETKWKCYDCLLPWLKAPHETTADEDFAEIGFDLTSKPSVSSYLTYRDSNNRIFYINNDGNNEYDVDEDGGEVWNDKLIDQIRTIADKKRKEMGWK